MEKHQGIKSILLKLVPAVRPVPCCPRGTKLGKADREEPRPSTRSPHSLLETMPLCSLTPPPTARCGSTAFPRAASERDKSAAVLPHEKETVNKQSPDRPTRSWGGISEHPSPGGGKTPGSVVTHTRNTERGLARGEKSPPCQVAPPPTARAEPGLPWTSENIQPGSGFTPPAFARS